MCVLTRQFSSCVLTVSIGDSLDSINASSAIVKYVSQRAGIGINAGRIRALERIDCSRRRGLPHRLHPVLHKALQTAVKSVRRAACAAARRHCSTDVAQEVESLLVLKNNRRG
ncbi:hypothetical protein KCP75_11760 [Salmonella enterica subsp. enterica]|nr:hypothetical protein KCP75_11760 [Salmonella enterica subsp. enterica]